MKRFAFLLAMISLVFADLRTDLANLKLELEESENSFWQLKDEQISHRKALDEELTGYEQEIKSMYLKKNSLTEEFFLVKDNTEQVKAELEQKREGRQAFLARIEELTEKLKASSRSLFPSILDEALPKITSLSGDSTDKGIIDYFNYLTWLLASSQSMEVREAKLVTEDNETVQGQALRLGFVHESFTSQESEALLVREADVKGVRYEWQWTLPGNVRAEIKGSILNIFNADQDLDDQKALYLPIDITQAGSKLRAISEIATGNVMVKTWRTLASGGPLMLPLIILALASLAIVIERLRFFTYHLKELGRIEADCKPLLKEKQATALWDTLKTTSLRELYAPILQQPPSSREVLEERLSLEIAKKHSQWNKWLPLLAVLGSIAPLMGLLGTVSGMISLFQLITLYSTNNPKILAGGISIALVTTLTGLSIAIPVILSHHYLVGKRKELEEKVEEMVTQALSIFAPAKK